MKEVSGVFKRMINKILSMAMAVSLLAVSVCGTAALKAKADSPEVQLYYARVNYHSDLIDGTTVRLYYVEGYISISSGGSNKDVVCHYGYNSDPWQDVSASYIRTDPSGYEVWYFKTPEIVVDANGMNWDFALRCDVDGSTYWDNNGGSNYNLWMETGNPQSVNWVLGKSAVVQDYAYHSSNIFSGSIVLKNLAYTKTVKVRYTTDNWATYTDLAASYDSSLPNNLERWDFSTTVGSGETIQYAIDYTVNGVDYWDNYFGENYIITPELY